MITLFYQRQFGKFECVRITGEGKDIRFLFDEPINARLLVNGRICEIKNGDGVLSSSLLKNGICEPTLYVGKRSEKIGSFLVKCGSVSYNQPDFEYTRELSRHLETLRKKVDGLEGEIELLKKKIYGESLF